MGRKKHQCLNGKIHKHSEDTSSQAARSLSRANAQQATTQPKSQVVK
jgi:hypothetical protein